MAATVLVCPSPSSVFTVPAQRENSLEMASSPVFCAAAPPVTAAVSRCGRAGQVAGRAAQSKIFEGRAEVSVQGRMTQERLRHGKAGAGQGQGRTHGRAAQTRAGDIRSITSRSDDIGEKLTLSDMEVSARLKPLS
ncbi:MAG: hypothetical protein FRX49_10873 [Trebouxia sp. A1-2]|nr:MAG: hypothetical protein FRX49_10873 [Trebouxia sp. A1-2]